MIAASFREWKPCRFNPERYLVSPEGLIWSKRSKKFLKQSTCKQGYKKITLHKNKVKKSFKVHRLVALEFVWNTDPDTKIQVNHKDGRKDNNHFTNLEWTTPLENTRHAIKEGLHNNVGENNGSSKLKLSEVKDIKYGKLSRQEAAQKYSVSLRHIDSIRSGRRWKSA